MQKRYNNTYTYKNNTNSTVNILMNHSEYTTLVEQSEIPRFYGNLRCCHSEVSLQFTDNNILNSPNLGKFFLYSKVHFIDFCSFQSH